MEWGHHGEASERQSAGGELDQSFRQSFYSSGTDWSRLYEVDEYGMPLNCNGEEEEATGELSFEAGLLPMGIVGEDVSRTPKFSGVSRPETLDVHPGNTGNGSPCRDNMEIVVKTAAGKSMPKLVQSDLSSFLGIKPKAPPDRTPSAKRFRQMDVGVLLGISTSRIDFSAGAEFLSKFHNAGSIAAKSERRKGKGEKGSFEVRANGGAQLPRKCPFYKKIPGTPFTVDAFRYGEVEGCAAYFLTHFHADHYGGLTKKWCHGPIYCTPITARLVVICLRVDPRWIIPLQLGVTHIIEGVEVRMLDANHCPGAALVLFRTKAGCQILHTGDFRACKEMQNYPELLGGNITTLYLDTTYCNERYRFPLQKEVINFVIRQTSIALTKNSKTLVVVGSYSIGKERVYVSMAEALGVQVFADSHRRRILNALEWPALATRLSMDPSNTFLHVLPLSNLNPQKLKVYLQSYHPKYSAVLAFRPTGWTYTSKLGEKLEFLKPQCSGPVTIYGVPYSEHSSFTELRDFVQFLRPCKIIPTVNNAKEEQREHMKVIFSKWLA